MICLQNEKNLLKLMVMLCESNLERHSNCPPTLLLSAPLGRGKYG